MENTHLSESNQMTRHGLRMFGLLAVVVFVFAIAYCYSTDHFMETGILGVVVLGLGILLSSMYYSAGKKPKSK